MGSGPAGRVEPTGDRPTVDEADCSRRDAPRGYDATVPGAREVAANRRRNRDRENARAHAEAVEADLRLANLRAVSLQQELDNERKKSREPAWWVRDLIVGLGVGALLAGMAWYLQSSSDRAAEDRDVTRAKTQADHAEALENLRFVRDHSGPGTTRPFRGMDLSGLRLDYLDLSGADFSGADLTGATFVGTDLTNAKFDGKTDLTSTDFTCSVLLHATFDKTDASGATFDKTNLTMVNISTGEGDVHAKKPVTIRDSSLVAAQLQTRATILGGFLPYAHLWFSDLTGSRFGAEDAYGVDAESTVTWQAGFDPSRIESPGEAWDMDGRTFEQVHEDAVSFPATGCETLPGR